MATRKNKTYNQSALIAKHFGFSLEDQINVSNESVKLAKAAKKEPKYVDEFMPAIEEVIQLLTDYKEFEKENGSVPMFLYFDKPANGGHTKQRKRAGEEQISLHILGVEDSIAEAIMLKTISVILSENGVKKHTIQLNNIGGKESQTLFNRESTAFFRKHISMLNANCRQFLKEGIHSLITKGGDQCKVLKEHAPEPMDFLVEETRQKFSQLLERVESFEIPYEINPDILGDLNYSNHTTFYFVDNSNDKIAAAGTRYNLLSKKIGVRKEIPAISANIWIKKSKTVTQTSVDKLDKNPLFLLQLGQNAKTFALSVIHKLWDAKINVKHALTRDRLTPQIQMAKKMKAENVLIIGHKEALDMNVMIRDSEGKSQRIFEVDELIEYVKNLK